MALLQAESSEVVTETEITYSGAETVFPVLPAVPGVAVVESLHAARENTMSIVMAAAINFFIIASPSLGFSQPSFSLLLPATFIFLILHQTAKPYL